MNEKRPEPAAPVTGTPDVLSVAVVGSPHPDPHEIIFQGLDIIIGDDRSDVAIRAHQHPLYVFPFGKPDDEGNETTVHRMNDSAWKKARIRATKKWEEKYLRPAHEGSLRIRIHDLKHSFGRRLRAAGVNEEDRKALLGHKNGSITSNYSAAELDQLIAAANKVSATDSRASALTILKMRQI